MPWFETPSTNQGRWGIHWTMADRNPDLITDEQTGRRQIASHFYPLIGPYASSDPFVIEYQILLMKMAGIDGVLFDFYGTSAHADYPLILHNVQVMIGKLSTAGLGFAFVYEDQSVRHALDAGVIPDALRQASADMRWMGSHFKTDGYIRLSAQGGLSDSGKPLLMVFGPQYFQQPDAWATLIGSLPENPALLPLWYESSDVGTTAGGEFSWIYQDSKSYLGHLGDFYATDFTGRIRMAVAFPGFQDFYAEGGWGANLFRIDHRAGVTFEETLALAMKTEGPIQLATWNDYGEGTMIEPTVEFGFQHLETLQDELGVDATPQDLRLAERLYRLRISSRNDASLQADLDRIYDLIVTLRWSEAERQLTLLE